MTLTQLPEERGIHFPGSWVSSRMPHLYSVHSYVKSGASHPGASSQVRGRVRACLTYMHTQVPEERPMKGHTYSDSKVRGRVRACLTYSIHRYRRSGASHRGHSSTCLNRYLRVQVQVGV